jgi:hypothetical protein
MDAIFNAGNAYAQNDEILEKIAMLFIEIAAFGSYYDYIAEYVSKIAEFTFYIVFIKMINNFLPKLNFNYRSKINQNQMTN